MPWYSSGTSQIISAIAQVRTQLTTGLAAISTQLKGIAMSQAELEAGMVKANAALDKIQTDAAEIETGLAAIATKISNGQAATIDLTSVNALVARAQAIQGTVDQAAADTTAEAAPAAPPAAPTQ